MADQKTKKSIEHRNPGYDLKNEIEKLTGALDSLNFYTDPQFFKSLKKDDIIEVYQYPELRQVYANSKFSEICSYTKEQMETIPFTTLFWRDEQFQKELLERAAQVTLHETKSQPWNLGLHELVESLHPRKRTFQMELGSISPCFDKQTHQRKGWVCSLQVALIYEWTDDGVA